MPAYSLASGQRAPDIRLVDFSGGRVSVPYVIGPASVAQREAVKAQNIDIAGASIRKQRGFSKLTSVSAGGDVSTIHYDFFTKKVYVAYADKLGTYSAGTITQLVGASGFTPNLTWSFGRVGNYLFCTNGTDAPKTWNDATSTLAPVVAPPATWIAGNYPTSCVDWMGRVFAYGMGTEPDILYYSKLYDANTWAAGITATDGGAQRIGNDGTAIKCVFPLANGLLIFKEVGVYYFTGINTFNTATKATEFDQTKFDWQLLTRRVDAVSSKGVVAVGDAIYVWGRTQVYQLMSTQTSAKIDIKIISMKIAYDVINVSQFQNQICAVHYPDRNQIWFGVAQNAQSTGIDTVHVYSYLLTGDDQVGGWAIRTGYQHKCMAEIRDPNNIPLIYSGGYAATPYLYQQNSTLNFDGAAMECIFWTAWVPLGQAGSGKSNRVIFMLGPQTTQNIQYTYAYDFSDGYYDTGTLGPDPFVSTWNSGSGNTWGSTFAGRVGTWITGHPFIQVVRVFGRGRRMQHRFYSNVINSDFDILEILHPVTSVGYV